MQESWATLLVQMISVSLQTWPKIAIPHQHPTLDKYRLSMGVLVTDDVTVLVMMGSLKSK
jgi:hypothetical protein